MVCFLSIREVLGSNPSTPTKVDRYGHLQIREWAANPRNMPRQRAAQQPAFELSDAIASLLDEYAYEGSAKTHSFYADNVGRALGGYLAARGVVTLEAVTRDHVRDFLIAEKRRTYTRHGQPDVHHLISNSTLRHRYGAARRFFGYCVERGWIAHSPMEGMRAPRKEKRAVFPFSQDEARRLVRYASQASGWLGKRDRALILLMLGTGARADEVLGVAPGCINWPKREIVLHGKGGKDRRMRLGPELYRALREYDAVRPKLPGNLWWVTQRNTRLTYPAFWMVVKHLGEYAGVEDSHPHRFRHTFATEFTAANRDIRATQRRLGHEKIQTTENYLHALGVDYGLEDGYRTPDIWLV
ncbi:MAG: tyrosine-type recombinase/integrase [Gemmatimonadaceae bacterium]|nr:tyrosine-type recombinase/integrase [Gemmatimonadaceae bacterium]